MRGPRRRGLAGAAAGRAEEIQEQRARRLGRRVQHPVRGAGEIDDRDVRPERPAPARGLLGDDRVLLQRHDQHIGLEQIRDGLWNIVYYRTLIGRIDERAGTITGV